MKHFGFFSQQNSFFLTGVPVIFPLRPPLFSPPQTVKNTHFLQFHKKRRRIFLHYANVFFMQNLILFDTIHFIAVLQEITVHSD